ncbi:MAG: hypothetical protein C4527_06680 [Candidatus Omnitrophota bacterium]|nr:MAG: hypothetical protein C4527_06680 [Candidatus Omnitrophota bacterium]
MKTRKGRRRTLLPNIYDLFVYFKNVLKWFIMIRIIRYFSNLVFYSFLQIEILLDLPQIFF